MRRTALYEEETAEILLTNGTVALTIFLVNRQSLSHGIENSQPLSISAQEQIMIFGQHKTEALFPASEF